MTRKLALVVTNLLIARGGLEDDLRRELEVVALAEREAAFRHGADVFELHTEAASCGRFLLIERWKSRSHFDAFHARHRPRELAAFLPRADGLLERPVSESVSFWNRRLV